jgi:hypothetical protein
MLYSGLSKEQQIFNIIVDIVFVFLIIWYSIHVYHLMTPDDKKNWWTFSWRLLKKDTFSRETFYFLIFSFGIILFLKYKYNIELTSPQLPISLHIFNKKVLSFLAFVVVFGILSFLFNIQLGDYLYDLTAFYWNKYIKWIYNSSSPSPFSYEVPPMDKIDDALASTLHDTISPVITSVTNKISVPVPEVFNIGNNEFTYTDAKAICMSVGSRLATYEELEDAYKHGAEWCKYGWTEGQMALFPTQKETWNYLQKNTKKKHHCGRPGINGGYIKNPNTLYSANCFGIKPSNPNFVPNTDRFASAESTDPKVEYWKKHKNDLSISPYNPDTWSSIQ